MLTLVLQFIFCSTIIVISGYYLSKYGDLIAERTGMSRAWVGLVLMASITSLPELMTGISSVTIANVPNIALGDVLGSCVFNIAILALMDSFLPTTPIFTSGKRAHILSAVFSIMLLITVLFFMMHPDLSLPYYHIGISTPIIIFIYIVGMRLVFYYEKKAFKRFVRTTAEKIEEEKEKISIKEIYSYYALNAIVIMSAASWLPFIARDISIATGIGTTFIGTALVALTTSLPEIVVSITAIKLNARDMAIANMLGSNMFNILILSIDDLFYTKGPLLANVSKEHSTTVIFAIIMTTVATVGLTYRPEKKALRQIGWDTFAIILLLFVNLYLLYTHMA